MESKYALLNNFGSASERADNELCSTATTHSIPAYILVEAAFFYMTANNYYLSNMHAVLLQKFSVQRFLEKNNNSSIYTINVKAPFRW